MTVIFTYFDEDIKQDVENRFSNNDIVLTIHEDYWNNIRSYVLVATGLTDLGRSFLKAIKSIKSIALVVNGLTFDYCNNRPNSPSEKYRDLRLTDKGYRWQFDKLIIEGT